MRYPNASREQLSAPPSQFRVVGVDAVEGESGYHVGDFATLAEALDAAHRRGCVGSPMYVYDDAGRMLVRVGSWLVDGGKLQRDLEL